MDNKEKIKPQGRENPGPWKLLLHDLEPSIAASLFPNCTEDQGWLVFSKDDSIHHCIGCFGCWVKTPGICVIQDKHGHMGEYLAQCTELVLISQCCYGGPSPFVKNVLDRSISYLHPYFVIKNKEMHHRQRYQRTIDLRVLFYGKNLTQNERKTAIKWVNAMAINLYCHVKQVLWQENPAELEALL